jgi:hypothetical protein
MRIDSPYPQPVGLPALICRAGPAVSGSKQNVVQSGVLTQWSSSFDQRFGEKTKGREPAIFQHPRVDLLSCHIIFIARNVTQHGISYFARTARLSGPVHRQAFALVALPVEETLAALVTHDE